ncbi:MAG TPA: CheB methylesterase domain-containing protein, partial [Trichocoleus sp.]
YPATPSLSRASTLDIRAPRIIAIGASTGGPNALHTLLRALPLTLPVPVLCVQHISEGFLPGLIDWLRRECRLPIVIAQAGQIPQSGTVYFAPEDRHLEIDASGRLACTPPPPVDGHCPSATVLFKSVAAFYRRSSIGVLLTGMGRDGANGLLAIAQAGGLTLAQDEATCVVFGMPKEAIALGAAQHVLPVQKIGPHIASVFSNS